MPPRTVFSVLEETARKYGDQAALHQPLGGKQAGYRSYNWNEWLLASREIAVGLRALGLNKGDLACILSETRAEFYLVDLGIMGSGGVAAALYTSNPMLELAKNVRAVQPNFFFVEDAKSLAAIAAALEGELPPHVVLIEGEAEGAITLDALRRKGRELEASAPGVFDRVCAELAPSDPAVLYLTSGATGEPKMGLTSHAAILANIEMAPRVLPIGPDDSTVVFLPSAHIAQRIVLEFVPMFMGTPVWFSESLAKLPIELRQIRPTFFLAPPRVWERMYATICNEAGKRSAVAKKLFYGALGLGMEAHRLKLAGKPLPGWMQPTLKLADRLVFSKVKARLGGRLRIAACGAAPLGKDLGEFFAAIGMPLIEGFGLTEAGVLAFNPLHRPKPGSIGTLLPGVEARIAEDGELLVRTPCIFMGYYKDQAATRSVLSLDGWFATGDIAEVDLEGYYYITGRKKELIVSSNGKKIYPARIENLFKMEPIVNQVLLIGDKQPYLTALLTLNLNQVRTLKGMDGLSDRPAAEQIESPVVATALQSVVARVNKQLADFERIRRYRVLDRDFSIERGELTPTMKIRRARVLENYRAAISELYLGRGETF
jgi:long-chain acyl-CoA synthetase